MKSMQWPEILLPGEEREREEKYIKWLIKKEACALPSRGYSLLSHPMWGSFPNSDTSLKAKDKQIMRPV